MLLVSCGGPASTVDYRVVQQASLAATATAPAPTETVLVSITGRIAKPNAGQQLDLDERILKSLAQVEYETYDAAIRERVTYRGVLLADVLQLAGADQDATLLHAIALDDYETDIPLDALKWPVMLALYRDNERLTTRNKGPVQIVFPTQSDIDPQTWDPKWVWSLRTLEVQ